jgi:cytochrome c oxidase cbb3-type subunit III
MRADPAIFLMTSIGWRARLSTVAPLTLLTTVLLTAQDGSPPSSAAARGGDLFRERCAECHGADGKGVAGHDLTRLWAAGATDARVLQTIRNGVPNTIMPSTNAPDDDLRAVVAYLRGLNGPVSGATARGNAATGERIFSSMCASCHAVDGRGGRLGPELSRIGEGQSRDALTRAIRDPNAATAAGYQTVTLVTRDGQRIRGTIKGEDAFSIQIMDTGERLQGYLKSRLREVLHERGSLMPAFGADRVSDSDLEDLLQYLSAQK